jgi:hypothetical protein
LSRGKPIAAFPDHALCFKHDLSENRYPFFRIMLWLRLPLH